MQAPIELEFRKIVDLGKGDVPVVKLRFRGEHVAGTRFTRLRGVRIALGTAEVQAAL